MIWTKINRADQRGACLADRHYNRQSVGSRQFVAPGKCLVLLSQCGRAVWASLHQKHVRHKWPGLWNNCLFRNEGAGRSSNLIREAVAATLYEWGGPPDGGMITFIDSKKVKSQNPGYCYKKAGFRAVGHTKINQLLVLQLLPDDMPAPSMYVGAQFNLPLEESP